MLLIGTFRDFRKLPSCASPNAWENSFRPRNPGRSKLAAFPHQKNPTKKNDVNSSFKNTKKKHTKQHLVAPTTTSYVVPPQWSPFSVQTVSPCKPCPVDICHQRRIPPEREATKRNLRKFKTAPFRGHRGVGGFKR